MLPDERQPEIFRDEIQPSLRPGKVLVAAHGLTLYFRRIELPDGVASVLVRAERAGEPGAL